MPRWCFSGATFHNSFSPMPNFCGSRSLSSSKRLMSCFDNDPRTLGKQRVLGVQRHTARERVLVLAILGHAHVAGRDSDHLAVLAVEYFGRGEPGIDLDAE